ncbi:MAG: GNAT family N-acetyltransferase [Rhodothermales bacterium]
MAITHIIDDAEALAEWDRFQMESPRGHYLQLSSWLKSFSRYGFDAHIIAERDAASGRIAGGIGMLRFGRPPFTLMSVPMGPTVDSDREDAVAPLLDEALRYAREEGAFLLQIKYPHADAHADPALLERIERPSGMLPRAGFPFNLVSAPNQLLWIPFDTLPAGDGWQDALFEQFNSGTRRNIRKAEKSGLVLSEARTEAELQAAYALIEQNGVEQGYSTRTWEQFGTTLVEQVNKGEAVVLVATREGEPLGTHYGVVAGRRYSYIMGGTVRTEPDYKVGHFLHWNAIQRAHAMGLRGYDFTSGGSPGVMRFKLGFSPTHVPFVEPDYVVLSPVRFAVFSRVYPFLQRHKSSVARVASRLLGRQTA